MVRILIISAYLVLDIHVMAQHIIPRAGVTLSTMDMPEFDGSNFRYQLVAGFTGGVGFEFHVDDFLSLQPEINFIQKGISRSGSTSYTLQKDNGGTISYYGYYSSRLKANYIEFPLLIKYKLPSKETISFWMGFSVAIHLDAERKEISGSIVDDQGTILRQHSEYHGEDFGFINKKGEAALQVGASVILLKMLSLEARYVHGLTDVNDGFKSNFRTLQISISVPIQL